MRRFYIFLFAIVLTMSCYHNKPQKEELPKPNSNEEKSEIDPLDQSLYSSMVKVFEKKGNPFSIELYSEITGKEVDTIHDIIGISTLEHLVNEATEQFVFQLDCMAGGNCCRYELLELRDQAIVRHKLIGVDMSSLYRSNEFSYTIRENKIIELIEHRIEYDEDENVVLDTIITNDFK